MHHRPFAILFLLCFAAANFGCAHKTGKTHTEEFLLPSQTGSLLPRRVVVEVPGPAKKSKKRDSKKAPKTSAAERKAQPTPEPEKPPQPEETPSPPDKFR